jgi:hypothetical protein
MRRDLSVPVDHCPLRGHHIDAALGAHGEARPTPGDITICLYCRGLLVFTADLRHRVLTNAEYLALPVGLRAFLSRARECAKRVMEAR